MNAFDRLNAISPLPTITRSRELRFISNKSRYTVTIDDVLFGIETVIDTVLTLQSNRPISRLDLTTSIIELIVTQDTDIIVYPLEDSPEVIRRAMKDENLKGVPASQQKPVEKYVPILQDGDVAYVSQHHVNIVSNNSDKEQDDLGTD